MSKGRGTNTTMTMTRKKHKIRYAYEKHSRSSFKHKVTPLVLLLLIPLFSFAQQVTFKGRAPQAVVLNDKFQLAYTINTDATDIRLPQMDAFQILMGPSISRQYNISNVNGKVTRETTFTYTYILKATKTGTFTIAPATIEVKGNRISSNSLTIEVIKDNTPARSQSNTPSAATGSLSSKELFITNTVSKSTVYKGQPLVLTTRIYTQVNLDGISDKKDPKLPEFLIQELDNNKINWTVENINGKTYNVGVFERKLLFPQRTGKITIEPTEIEFTVKKRIARRSQSIFDDFFESNYRIVKQRVKTKPITITVKPLRGIPPEGFTGGVGNLSMKVTTSKTKVKTNESITFKVVISGTGNHKMVTAPKIKFPVDFDQFDPTVTNNFVNTVAGMKGTKTFEYLVIPRHAGTYIIPSIKFSYFDPAAGKYKTVSSGPINIEVEKGEGEEQLSTVVSANNRESVKFLGKDIRFIKTGPVKFKPAGTFLFGSFTYYASLIIPLLIFLLVYFINRKKLKERSNMQLLRTKKANKVARKRLKQSAVFLKAGNKEQFYEEVLRALWGYTSDKLSIPISQLNRDNIRSILEESNVSKEVIDTFIDILDTCEFARYAPESGSEEMDRLYNTTLETISKIENQINKKR